MPDPTLSTVVAKAEGVLDCRAGEEQVLLAPETERYFGLNELGAAIWRELDERPASIGEIVDRLLAGYDVDPEQCRRDVVDFVRALSERGLVRLQESPRGEGRSPAEVERADREAN